MPFFVKKPFFPLLLGLLCMVSCRRGLHSPTAEEIPIAQKKWSTCDLTSLKQGHDLYVQNCHHCHKLYKPLDFCEDSWVDVLPEMCKKAHLSKEEQLLIRQFMVTRLNYELSRGKHVRLE
jgi:hypothetical protein